MSNRDTRGDEYRGSRDSDDLVKRLLKEKASEYDAFTKLRREYPNDSKKVSEVMEAYKETLSRIYKKAKKFKQVLMDRYSGYQLPMADLMKKAKKFQKKYKFTDEEFAMFILLVTTEHGSKYALSIPTSKMARTLGYDAAVQATTKLEFKADDASAVEEIVNKYGETKPLHAQVLLQTLQYRDCAPEALTGKFDPHKHNPYSYVHPVLAALFLPKVKLLDDQMLISNIGYIVNQKAKGQQIQTLPDHNLYWNMITDPNDTACHINNTIVDLKNRYHLQTQLWDAVMKLRLGQYYYGERSGLVNFMSAIENCRSAIHDAPDLTYVKDEGTILRRLLAAFSLYPTYVSVNRLWGSMGGLQVGMPGSSYDVSSIGNVSRVPMITLRLPLNAAGAARPVTLSDALTQPQWFVENKTIVPKSLNIIHSHDVVFFYVGRRYQQVSLARLNLPFNFTNLPMTVTGWESLNEHPVNAPEGMTINGEQYLLRSVVTVEKSRVANSKNVIVGSSTLICIPRDLERNNLERRCYLYDPQGSGIQWVPRGQQAPNDNYQYNQPITWIPCEQQYASEEGALESFDHRAMTRGTIYMYQKQVSYEECITI